MSPPARLDWERDGTGWPHHQASRFVEAGGLRWHVQVLGEGSPVLLVHGTGASSHSWRAVAPLLADRFTVVMPDLPGHGFSAMPAPRALSLPGMARALAALLEQLGIAPQIVAGHSAGAAVLARMCLDQRIAPRRLVSFNGAFLPLRGLPSQIFSPAARIFARLPMVPRMFSALAGDQPAVERLLRDTGSRIDPEGMALYRRLVRNPGHVAGALAMMAHWDLDKLAHELPHLSTPLLLVTGSNDRTIPPAEARRVRAMVKQAEIVSLPGLGHLAHEEDPAAAAALVSR